MKDGEDHINIYSQGQTKLGRWLSNFHKCDVNTDHGHFKSIEGYWYWLGARDDSLRKMWGYKAKKYGRSRPQVTELPEDTFQGHIEKAIINKIYTNKYILEAFVDSSLPFDHYYVYGGKRVDAGYEWITDHITELRKIFKEFNIGV